MKYDTNGFEKIQNIRFKKETIKLIKKIIDKDQETYENISHFIRASTLRRIREERLRLRI